MEDGAGRARLLREAAALREAERYGDAYAVLLGAGEAESWPPEAQLALALDKLRCLLHWTRASAPEARARLLFAAQRAFQRAVYVHPLAGEAYELQAALWECCGDQEMAARLRATSAWITDPGVPAPPLPPAPEPAIPPPPALPQSWRPRVLILGIPGYDPGMDVLYDGLHAVLGPERVLEYPWKPMLHGARPECADNYPTVFKHPGEPRDLSSVCAELRAGAFDLILYADLLDTLPREVLRALLDAGGAIPLAIVDGWDDASDHAPLLRDRLERAPIAIFKREMLRSLPYSPETIPLPLAYPRGLLPDPPPARKTRPLFWAGNRYYGMRRLYLEALEQSLGSRLDAKLPQAAYAEALGASLIGLSCCGFGFDTVRYWETPAHGALLLAEKPPIRIHRDFEDGVTALFFRTPGELFHKLERCLANPDEAAHIAAAGRRHALEHHTGEARARQLLGHLAARLHPGPS